MTILLKDCLGLNTALHPRRLTNTDLAYAMNVVVKEGGRLESADSATKTISLTSGHSLYSMGSYALCMDGGSIKKVISSTEAVTIATGYSGDEMCFCRVGNMAIFTNSNERGIIQNDTIYDWEVDEYSAKDRIKTDRYLESTIPPFDYIFQHGSYLIGIIGNALFSCAVPGKFGLWDLSEPIMFGSDIIMATSLWANGSQGIFVSDEENIWFLAGTNCLDFVQGDPITNYPAYKKSLAQDKVNGAEIGLNVSGNLPVWNSSEGVCIGVPGAVINATKKRIVHPDLRGANGATLVRDYRVITTVNKEFTLDVNLNAGNAATQRSTYNFNSYCRIAKNLFLGCKSDGIYTLGGSGVVADFETAATDFEWNGEKSVRFLEIEGEFDAGSFSIYPIVDGVQKSAIPFTQITITSKTVSATVPYELQGNWWAFKIVATNINIKIDSIVAYPILLPQGKKFVY